MLYETIGALSIRDFCRAYAVGRSRAYQLLNDGSITGRKFGRATLIDRASAEGWHRSLPDYHPQSRTPGATAHKGTPRNSRTIAMTVDKVAMRSLEP